MQKETIYINFKGGLISPGYLKGLLDIAASCHVQDVRFALRQQLIMDIPAKKYEEFQRLCVDKQIDFFREVDRSPNIVSSYVTANLFLQDGWLTEGVYKDVFDLFAYQPKLKINICDGRQTFTPLFSGHLNWISSSESHFWYLQIRLPGTDKILSWPGLVYTNDLARVSKTLEDQLLSGGLKPDQGIDKLYQLTIEKTPFISKPSREKLTLPDFHLPYYEGFNKDGGSWWLGIYRRDELYPLDFLRDLCKICLASRIGVLYCTSWKSLIIKGISANDRKAWDQLLGKYRINVRHAANELNWQVEDDCEDGLILKRHVIRHFDKEDVRTYGLCFAVHTRPGASLFGSVVIRRQAKKSVSRLKSQERFDILYSVDFNPNNTELRLFRAGVEKEQLGTYLVSLCKYYYEKESLKGSSQIFENFQQEEEKKPVEIKKVFQCRFCLSVYDEQHSHTENSNNPPVAFADLPASYECPLCEAPKEDFIEVNESSLMLERS